MKNWIRKRYNLNWLPTWNRLNSWRVQRTSPFLVRSLFFIRQIRTDFLFRKFFKWGSCKLLYSPGLNSLKYGSARSKSIVIPGTSWGKKKFKHLDLRLWCKGQSFQNDMSLIDLLFCPRWSYDIQLEHACEWKLRGGFHSHFQYSESNQSSRTRRCPSQSTLKGLKGFNNEHAW